MHVNTLDAEAGEVSTELIRCGVAASTRVHAMIELGASPALPMEQLAHKGGAFDWRAQKPELYADADLVE